MSDSSVQQKKELAIDYTFKDESLLTRALTHRSFSNEHNNAPHNERLEFLGDAVLQYVTTIALYRMYPDEQEGTLSVYRSLLVKTSFLIEVAERLGVRECLQVSSGQEKDVQKASLPILADAVEALIGAIYLDGGLASAQEFIQTHILADARTYLSNIALRDAKTELQELVQRDTRLTPEYVILSKEGPDHDTTFTVAVKVGDTVRATAAGKSKQDASQKAAQLLLEEYKKQ